MRVFLLLLELILKILSLLDSEEGEGKPENSLREVQVFLKLRKQKLLCVLHYESLEALLVLRRLLAIGLFVRLH